MKSKYIPYIVLLFLFIAVGFLFKSNKDIKLERKFLKEKNELIEQEFTSISKENNELKEQEKIYVDSIQSQNRKISDLKYQKANVVYVPITREIVAESDTSAIIEAINEGRRCLAEMEISNLLIRELDTQIFYKDSLIFNLRESVENLQAQLELRSEQMELYRSEIGSYKKHVRRIKWQRNFVIIGGVVVVILVAI